jgi:threonylcarbamoyladenosine tRNA methylthiotransferase MtaB
MKFAIVTFGCRVNQADSLHIEEDLRQRGAEASGAESADLVIVNTCSVTSSADQGARQTIRRIARLNPHARIVATGCYATRCTEDVASLPGVVRVIRNDDKLRVADLLEIPTSQRYGGGEGPCGSPLEPGMAGRTAFTLRVQTGCDQSCSYCIIPTTRGRGRSLPLESVVREARRVADSGFREVAITGVHLGSYGRDLPRPSSLFELLCALQRAELDITFRISSLEPMDCTPDIIDLVSLSGGYFAPHFHLPLQHASDRMLAAMRRPYTLDYYRTLVDGIVERLPHASIGTDMIVGFPGESENDFRSSVEYLESSPLSHVHVFPYSDRPGTAASTMTGKVQGETIRRRGACLRDSGARLSRRFRDAQVGTVRPGLTLDDGTTVITDNYLKVKVPPGLRRNRRVLVRILDDRAGLVITPPSSSRADDQGRQSSTTR